MIFATYSVIGQLFIILIDAIRKALRKQRSRRKRPVRNGARTQTRHRKSKKHGCHLQDEP